jgi:hypothetical protein
MDCCERQTTARPEQPAAGAKYRKFRTETAQDVGVHDGIKAAGSERLTAPGGHDIAGATGEPVSGGARLGSPQPLEREVGADDLTSRLRSEVEAGPPRPGADVGEAAAWPESQMGAEVVGLFRVV